MTTFQILLDSFFRAMTHLLPVSPVIPDSLERDLLHWTLSAQELEFLVLLTGSISFLVFFRYDWLGLLSALISSLLRPLTLRSEQRTLDQHTLLFLSLVFLPLLVLRIFFGSAIQENEWVAHPYFLGVLSFLTAGGLGFSYRWNKRIHGLNHLRLMHGVLISLLAFFGLIPGFPLIAALWIGFALCSYHTEAIFKYSFMTLGLLLFVMTAQSLAKTGFREAFDQIGYLNSVAVLVIGFTVFWIGLENLQKNLSESTYRTFQWLNLAGGLYFFLVHVLTS